MEPKLTFDELCELEPRLRKLYCEAQSKGRGRQRFRTLEAFFGYGDWQRRGLKRKLVTLVGWERKTGPDQLRTREAYETAYDEILNALPPDRG